MRNVSMLILSAALMLARPMYSQNTAGSITGRVIDQQESGVPGATVVAMEASTKVNVSTTPTKEGDFSLAGLSPGNYTITVHAQGFKKLESDNVPVLMVLGRIGVNRLIGSPRVP